MADESVCIGPPSAAAIPSGPIRHHRRCEITGAEGHSTRNTAFVRKRGLCGKIVEDTTYFYRTPTARTHPHQMGDRDHRKDTYEKSLACPAFLGPDGAVPLTGEADAKRSARNRLSGDHQATAPGGVARRTMKAKPPLKMELCLPLRTEPRRRKGNRELRQRRSSLVFE